MLVSMSVSTCRAQSDSMQENLLLVALGKEDGRGLGFITIRPGTRGGGDEGRGMRGSQS